jgi:cytochrome P450
VWTWNSQLCVDRSGAAGGLLNQLDARAEAEFGVDVREVPQAVEELMRHSPIVFAALRVATTDVELRDVVVSAGAYVIANTAAANRDPAVYDDPDRLDITRQGAPPMTTFGGGAHYCLGAHLARVELAEALKVITRRMPNARCTGPVPWKPVAGISGPTSLPIAFSIR